MFSIIGPFDRYSQPGGEPTSWTIELECYSCGRKHQETVYKEWQKQAWDGDLAMCQNCEDQRDRVLEQTNI